MPVVGLVVAWAAVLVPNRPPATITGRTNAVAARPENFVIAIISVTPSPAEFCDPRLGSPSEKNVGDFERSFDR
jgi:hypothetical protein